MDRKRRATVDSVDVNFDDEGNPIGVLVIGMPQDGTAPIPAIGCCAG